MNALISIQRTQQSLQQTRFQVNQLRSNNEKIHILTRFRVLISVFIAITFILGVGNVVLADFLNDYYWLDGPDPLTYRFYNYPDPEEDISQTTQDAFTMAAYYWEAAANSPVNFTYTSGTADIYCFDIYHDGIGATGWWDPAYTSGYMLARAHAVINTANTSSYSSNKRIGLAGHELGHCLGLAHHTGTIMTDDDWWRWDVWGIVAPKPEDITQLNILY